MKNDVFRSQSSLWKLKDIPDGGFTLQGQGVSVAKCLGNGFLHRACIFKLTLWTSGLPRMPGSASVFNKKRQERATKGEAVEVSAPASLAGVQD